MNCLKLYSKEKEELLSFGYLIENEKNNEEINDIKIFKKDSNFENKCNQISFNYNFENNCLCNENTFEIKRLLVFEMKINENIKKLKENEIKETINISNSNNELNKTIEMNFDEIITNNNDNAKYLLFIHFSLFLFCRFNKYLFINCRKNLYF